MKKILGIVGSPRRGGNTHVMVRRLLEGARERGAVAELVRLGDLDIRECDGCHACWKGRRCSKKDDMSALYGKIAGCDAIVLGTPVYWYGPTALMKCFIDRFVYFNAPSRRAEVRGKPVVLAIPFEENRVAVADLVVAFFAKSLDYLEMRLVGTILAPGVTERGEVGSREDVMDKCRRAGRRLATDATASARATGRAGGGKRSRRGRP